MGLGSKSWTLDRDAEDAIGNQVTEQAIRDLIAKWDFECRDLEAWKANVRELDRILPTLPIDNGPNNRKALAALVRHNCDYWNPDAQETRRVQLGALVAKYITYHGQSLPVPATITNVASDRQRDFQKEADTRIKDPLAPYPPLRAAGASGFAR